MSKVEIDLDTITDELDHINDQIASYKFEIKRLEKEKDKREMALGLFLKQNKMDNLVYGRFEFGFKEYTRTAFDQALFKQEQPELFEKYKLPKTTERFEFKLL